MWFGGVIVKLLTVPICSSGPQLDFFPCPTFQNNHVTTAFNLFPPSDRATDLIINSIPIKRSTRVVYVTPYSYGELIQPMSRTNEWSIGGLINSSNVCDRSVKYDPSVWSKCG